MEPLPPQAAKAHSSSRPIRCGIKADGLQKLAGFTGDIVVCVVSNQQHPPLGAAAVQDVERVT